MNSIETTLSVLPMSMERRTAFVGSSRWAITLALAARGIQTVIPAAEI